MAASWYRSARDAAGTVLVVDNVEAVEAILRERAQADSPEPPSTGAAPAPADAFARTRGLRREPLTEAIASLFFPGLEDHRRSIFHPLVWFARRPDKTIPCRFAEHPAQAWVIRTNAHGLRRARPVLAEKPPLRILVAGDSQVEGVCPDGETIPDRIEYRLQVPRGGTEAVEVLNAAIGSHTPYNYLGTLERYLDLRPDVFVTFVFGGNDLKGIVPIRRYFHRQEAPRGGRYRQRDLAAAKDVVQGLAYSELGQLYYFLNHPAEREVAVDTLVRILGTIADLARDRGIVPLFVHLPAPLSGNPLGYEGERDAVLAAAGLTEDDLCVTDALADGWIERAEAEGLLVLDLRPVTRSLPERLFFSDGHLNPRGNEVVAARVANAIEVLLAR